MDVSIKIDIIMTPVESSGRGRERKYWLTGVQPLFKEKLTFESTREKYEQANTMMRNYDG